MSEVGATGTLGFSPRRVAKNTAALVAAMGVAEGARALVAILLAREFGPASFGVFVVAMSVVGLASYAAPVGLDHLVVRDLNRRAGVVAVPRVLRTAAALGALAAVALLILPGLVARDADLIAALRAGSLYVAVSPLALVLAGVFRSRERMEMETGALTVEGIVTVTAVLGVLATGRGVAAALLAMGAGRVANALFGIAAWSRIRRDPVTDGWGPLPLLRAGFPLGLARTLGTLLIRIDIVLLGWLVVVEDVGFYGAASVIVLSLPMAATYLNSSLYPIFSRAGPGDRELRDLFRAAWRIQAGVGFAMAAGLAATAPGLVRLLYGEGYAPAVPILAAMAFVLPLRLVNHLAGITLNATDRDGRWARILGIAVTAAVVGNLALIPVLGVWGAVVTTLVVEVVIAGLAHGALAPVRPPFGSGVGEGILLAGVVGATAWLVPGHVLVQIAAGAVVFGIVAVWHWRRRDLLVVPAAVREHAA